MKVKCIVNGVEQELPLAGYQRIQMPRLGEVVVPVPFYSGHYWLEYNADMTIHIITDIPANVADQPARPPKRGDAAAEFGANDHDRAREYDKLNGQPGLRDCETRNT